MIFEQWYWPEEVRISHVDIQEQHSRQGDRQCKFHEVADPCAWSPVSNGRGKAAEIKETMGMDCGGQKMEGLKVHCKDLAFLEWNKSHFYCWQCALVPDFLQSCSVCGSYALRVAFTICFDSYYTKSDQRTDFWQVSYENSGPYVLSLIMNREKKRIDGGVGRKERKMDWGFYKNVCSSHNTDKKISWIQNLRVSFPKLGHPISPYLNHFHFQN